MSTRADERVSGLGMLENMHAPIEAASTVLKKDEAVLGLANYHSILPGCHRWLGVLV